MTISELGSLGEFLGSIAVLVTLIYLAIQVRQNTRHTKAQIGHDGWLVNTQDETAKLGDKAAETLGKADLGETELTDKDLKILDAYYRSMLLHPGRVEDLNEMGLDIYPIEQAAQAYIDSFNCKSGKVRITKRSFLSGVLHCWTC